MRADFTLNYREQQNWKRAVRDWTGGRGVDHVVEVGGPGTLAQSIEAVRVGGHISLIGMLTGRSGQVPTTALMAKQARLQGLIVGSRREQQDFVRALEAGALKPAVDRRFPLHQRADAFASRCRAGTSARRGGVVMPWEPHWSPGPHGNLLDGLEAAGAPLRRVIIYHGFKIYGIHLGAKVPTPARESDPPHMPPNLYMAQEAALWERSTAEVGTMWRGGRTWLLATSGAIR